VLSYHWVASSTRILKLFSLSYIPSEFTNPLLCRQVYTSARHFEEHELSYEQWKSVLYLSTRLGFASIRKLALSSIRPPTPFDQLLLARTYNVDHWVLPALSALCKRTTPIDLKEALQMIIEDVVVVATVREEIRSQRPSVDEDGIEPLIEAAQARMAAHVASDDVSPAGSESGVVEKEPPKEVATGNSAKEDSCNGTKEELAAITSEAVDASVHKSDEHSVSPCVVWLVNGTESLTRHRDCKVGTAEDSSTPFPVNTEKMTKEKHTSLGCDAGENTGANTAKSENIPDKDEAEQVGDTTSKEAGGKSSTRPGFSFFPPVPPEGEAEHVTDTASKEGGGESSTRPVFSSFKFPPDPAGFVANTTSKEGDGKGSTRRVFYFPPVPPKDEAELVADTTSKEGSGKSSTQPVFSFSRPAPPVDQGVFGSGTSARSERDSGKKEYKFRTPKVKLPVRGFASVPSDAESAGGSGGGGATTGDGGGSDSM
jgi:hypothetical protein